MSGRIYVVIFFCWAALTIITPTLILLSETSKPYSELQDEGSRGIKARRLIGYAVKHRMITTTAQESAPSPAPAPSPETGSRTSGIDLAKVFSESLRLVIRKTRLRLK
ncbi:PREDICTED: uncharacterized protein LOC101296634 [Fragaria vesca subsp. vesca]|uniref:uncharacterized protein LOC101296634 n=1 Tax=Fragaria vesca subsp. vesca TaxID=101020 RepID=UPI0002C2F63A|nr:PREDICTED: uncharacterized protein LOC101296634 [Fragaria vesca subsp. vesca]